MRVRRVDGASSLPESALLAVGGAAAADMSLASWAICASA